MHTCGQTQLLWEDEVPDMQQILKPLVVLQGALLSWLSINHNPVQRLSAANVCSAWKHIIDNITTAPWHHDLNHSCMCVMTSVALVDATACPSEGDVRYSCWCVRMGAVLLREVLV